MLERECKLREEVVGELSTDVGQFLGVRELKRKPDRGRNSQKGKRKTKKGGLGSQREEGASAVPDRAARSGKRRELLRRT